MCQDVVWRSRPNPVQCLCVRARAMTHAHTRIQMHMRARASMHMHMHMHMHMRMHTRTQQGPWPNDWETYAKNVTTVLTNLFFVLGVRNQIRNRNAYEVVVCVCPLKTYAVCPA